MGLGKTLQLIALHLHRAAAGMGPTLVVCPTSLLGNWEREVRRFAPGTPVRRYHGAVAQPRRPRAGRARRHELRRGAPRRRGLLGAAGFGLVVADEAQHAKNPETATAKALRTDRRSAAASPSPARRSRTASASCGRSSTGRRRDCSGRSNASCATVASPIERNRDPLATERLARTIRPFVLRRSKTDPGVAPDLPPRTVTDVPVPLTAEQATLYEAEVREALDDDQGTRTASPARALVLRLLTVLKQICNHPAQYLHQPGPLAGRSGKLAALEELLDVILAEGESVLVFSQFVECLALVEARLEQLGVPSLFLHGKVSAKRRSEMVDAFQAGEAPGAACCRSRPAASGST